MKAKVNPIKFIVLFVFSSLLSWSQTHRSKINIPPKSGYYKIELNPELIACSKYDLSDMRVWDEKNKQVPYLIEYSKPLQNYISQKTNFKVIKNNSIPKKYSEFIFQNDKSKPLNHIALLVTNTDVTKKINLLGSHNQLDWYSVINDYTLDNLYDNTKTSIEKIIYLPNTNYAFYKLQIVDSQTPPIIVQSIYRYNHIESSISKKIKLTNQTVKYYTNKNDNIIEYNSDYAYRIDEIQFDINESKLFNRSFSILADENYKRRVRQVSLFNSVLSKKNDSFSHLKIRQNKFKIQLYNQDNPPLNIQNIQLYYYPIYLIAALDSGVHYIVNTGLEELTAPNYDMVEFRDKIPANLPILGCTPIEKIIEKDHLSQKFYQKKWFMWICISIGVLIIFGISISMIKGLNKES